MCKELLNAKQIIYSFEQICPSDSDKYLTQLCFVIVGSGHKSSI